MTGSLLYARAHNEWAASIRRASPSPPAFPFWLFLALYTVGTGHLFLARIIAFITPTPRNCSAPVVLDSAHSHFIVAIMSIVTPFSRGIVRLLPFIFPNEITEISNFPNFLDCFTAQSRGKIVCVVCLGVIEKFAGSCEPVTSGELVPISRGARRSNIWDPFFSPSILLFSSYARRPILLVIIRGNRA